MLAFLMHDRGQDRLRDQVRQAQARAQGSADATIYDSVTAADVALPMTGVGYRDLLETVRAGILTDVRVARLRLWGADGTLIFSTDEREKIGRLRATDDIAITSALRGVTTSRRATADLTPSATGAGTGASPAEVFQTFAPLRTPDRNDIQGTVEIDQYWAPIADAASGSEGLWQTIFTVLAVLFGAVAALAFVRRTRAVASTDHPYDEAVTQTPDDAAIATLERRVAETERERAAVEDRAREAEQRLEAAESRAETAEDRAQAAESRAQELGVLGERVEVAERRALDAERRLQELSEQVEAGKRAARRRRTEVDPEVADAPAAEEPVDEAEDDLRARLARTAARKKPGGASSDSS
jgi:hypothetical protein